MIFAAFWPSADLKTLLAKYSFLPSLLAASSGAGRYWMYPLSIAIHLMKTAAASFCLLKGFIANDHDPVGVTGLPPEKTGCGATPQSTFDSISCGSSQGPWTS